MLSTDISLQCYCLTLSLTLHIRFARIDSQIHLPNDCWAPLKRLIHCLIRDYGDLNVYPACDLMSWTHWLRILFIHIVSWHAVHNQTAIISSSRITRLVSLILDGSPASDRLDDLIDHGQFRGRYRSSFGSGCKPFVGVTLVEETFEVWRYLLWSVCWSNAWAHRRTLNFKNHTKPWVPTCYSNDEYSTHTSIWRGPCHNPFTLQASKCISRQDARSQIFHYVFTETFGKDQQHMSLQVMLHEYRSNI